MWFDLSPRVLESLNLPDKAAASRLVHIVFTLAEQMQPSVIYIDEIEKVFAGKSKKGGLSENIKIKKDLVSHKELLSTEQRILIIGNSREPFDDSVDQDEICEFFNYEGGGKAFYCPHPDYSTRLKLWSSFISKKGVDVSSQTIHRGLNVGTLSHISSGYTAGSVCFLYDYYYYVDSRRC